jgi:hypothetical protein
MSIALIDEFCSPLSTKGRRHNKQNSALAFRPALGKHKPRLNSLTETDLISEQRAVGEVRLQSEQCRINLMWV